MIHCIDVKKYPKDSKVLPMGSDFPIDEFLVTLLTTDDSDLPTDGTDVEELPDGMKFAVGSKLLATNGGTESKEYVFDGSGFVEWIVSLISGGGGLEYESGEWIGNGQKIAQINFSDSHSEPPIFAMLWRPDDLSLRYANIYTIVCRYPSRINPTSETILDGHVEGKRRGSNGAMSDTGTTLNKTDGGRQSLSYWLTNERFTADGRGTYETWESGVTHKWIAIWTPEA